MEYLYIIKNIWGKKCILEKLLAFSLGLCYAIESYLVMNQNFTNSKILILWHDRLAHQGSTIMSRIIENSQRYPLKNQKILLSNETVGTAYLQGKFVIRPSICKVNHESLLLL